MPLKKWSLKTRLIIYISSAIVFFTAGILGIVFNYNFQEIHKYQLNNLQDITIRFVDEVWQVFNNNRFLVENFSRNKILIEFLNNYYQNNYSSLDNNDDSSELELLKLKVKDYLYTININDYYSAIYVLDRDGKTIVSTQNDFVDHNYNFRQYFKQAIKNDFGVELAIGVTSDKIGYYFAHSIKENGKVVGVLVMKLKPEFIEKYLFRKNNNLKQDIFFIDEDGVVVYSSDKSKLFNTLGRVSSEEREKILKKRRFGNIKIGSLGYDLIQGQLINFSGVRVFDCAIVGCKKDELLSLGEIYDYPFYILLKEKRISFFDLINRFIWMLTVAILSVVVALVAVIVILLNRFLKPLRYLEASALEIAKGNYNIKIEKKYYKAKEFINLVEAFNKMLAKIRNYHQKMEQKIKEQTADIIKQHQKLQQQQKAILNILEDVEQKKKEVEIERNKLESILINIADGIIILDAEKKVVLFNKNSSQITGYKHKDLIGKNIFGLFEIYDEDGKKKIDLKTMFGKKNFTNKIYLLKLPNKNKSLIINLSISVLKEDKKNIGYIIVFRDITKEREIDKAKTEFVSLASHQLRTPLSTMNWYIEMLLDKDVGPLTVAQKLYLEEIYKGSKRMIELVRSLLNVSRLELGTFVVKPEKIDVRKIGDEVIEELAHKISLKGLDFVKKYDKKIPKISLDPKLTKIIIQNLISNAVKYTPRKGKVIFSLKTDKKDLIIKVKDNGIGIPANEQKKIFNKLFRASNTNAEETEGTGLGLYIIKKILDTCDGEISFTSKLNKGSTFIVKIPLSGMKSKEGNRELT